MLRNEEDVVTVYSKNNCPQCMMTKWWFDRHGVTFAEYNIEDEGNENLVDEIKGMGILRMPVVFKGNDKVAVGFQPQELGKVL